jgi:signal transduction histidine kinase
MRRRIVLTNVIVSAITIVLFTTLVAWVSAARIVVTQKDSAQREAQRIAVGIDTRLAKGAPVSEDTLNGFVRSDESATITLSDGRVLNLGTPASDQRIAVATTSEAGTSVSVRIAGDSVVTAAGRIWAVLTILALVGIGIAALVARRLAAGLVEPVRDLAEAAGRLGEGDPRPARRRYGIEELDAVAEVLDVSATRIGEQIARERQLAADVSHQLRTPLTAVSMRLEEIVATDDPTVVRDEATIALQQVERLSGVVDDLLAFARHDRQDQSTVHLDRVLEKQLDEWQRAFDAEGRQLQVIGETGLEAQVAGSMVSQVVATLLENALVHGAGHTTMRTRRSGSSVVIEVADEGAGIPPNLVRRIFDRDFSGSEGSGLGLAVARALTEVQGGRLELIHAEPATFAVFLPGPRNAADAHVR